MRSIRWLNLCLLACLLTVFGAVGCSYRSGPGPGPSGLGSSGTQAPAGLSYSTNPTYYAPGVAITANGPSSTGGAVASYRVSPDLPAGLTFTTGTGVISGTPTEVTASASYTVTALNAAGSTQTTLVIQVVALPNANILVPLSVHPGDGWMKASAPNPAGMSYLWSMVGGTSTGSIGSGQGTGVLDFTAKS